MQLGLGAGDRRLELGLELTTPLGRARCQLLDGAVDHRREPLAQFAANALDLAGKRPGRLREPIVHALLHAPLGIGHRPVDALAQDRIGLIESLGQPPRDLLLHRLAAAGVVAFDVEADRLGELEQGAGVLGPQLGARGLELFGEHGAELLGTLVEAPVKLLREPSRSALESLDLALDAVLGDLRRALHHLPRELGQLAVEALRLPAELAQQFLAGTLGGLAELPLAVVLVSCHR